MAVVPVRRDWPRRVAMLSMHTSPLDQPGTGDAGGMNVYVAELARQLAACGTQVEVFTRATSGALPPAVELTDGVLVRHVPAGPYAALPKGDLPAQLRAFTAGVLRAGAAPGPGRYDVVHSHYWLSGRAGQRAAARWGVPLVHTMHTLALVKDFARAAGEPPEPAVRILGEAQVVAAADLLVANTTAEERALVELYGADPARVAVLPPGVDLDVFRPGDRAAARTPLGLRADAVVLLFVGRIQPLKAPDVLLRAAARMLATDPALRERLVVAVVGGPSGSGMDQPEALRGLAAELGIGDVVRFEPPVPRAGLPAWFRAADLTVVPSRSESFGLVALESQACGTPVVAADVGGLPTAVADGTSGVLVPGHDPEAWARVLAGLAADAGRRDRLSGGALAHAARFGWAGTAAAVLDLYAASVRGTRPSRAVGA